MSLHKTKEQEKGVEERKITNRDTNQQSEYTQLLQLGRMQFQTSAISPPVDHPLFGLNTHAYQEH